MAGKIESIEKRQYLRLEDNFRVQLAPWSPPAPADAQKERRQTGFSRDLSVGGVCLAAPNAISPGALMEASIHIAELAAPLSFVGEVIRCRRMESGQHQIALRFVPQWMDEQQRADLETFLYGQL